MDKMLKITAAIFFETHRKNFARNH